MKLNNLRPADGAVTKKRKRVGRGSASGWGKTSGRGMNGQNSRSGRLPKRGFTNTFAKVIQGVNVEALNRFEDGTEVTPELLIETGVVKAAKAKDGIKILGKGELTKKLDVKAHFFSESAKAKIEEAGGKVQVI